MFGIYFKEESKHMEQQGRAKGVEVSQDQILGVGAYADSQVQGLLTSIEGTTIHRLMS